MLALSFLALNYLASEISAGSIEGRQTIREIFPDPLHSNVDYGVGYNSISLSRTGTAAVNISTVSPRSRNKNTAFLSHSFQIKHFSSREDLQTEYCRESELTRSEGLVGNYKSKFRSVLLAEDVRVLDSVLTVDVDIVSDTASVRGPVELGAEARKLLDTGHFEQFINKYGTHFLRKKTYGGKLILLIKVPSKTESEKRAVDKKLKQAAGFIGRDNFRSKITEIEQAGRVELELYSLGGDPFNGSLSDLAGVVDHVLNFSHSVRSRDEVRSLEFGSVWNLPGVPSQFRQFVFQHQRWTDKILSVYSDLRGVETRIADISLLRDQELDWLSDEGHGKIQGIGVCLAKCQKNLALKFGSASVSAVSDVYEEFKDSGSELEEEIEGILQAERSYASEEEMYLINTGHMTYVSTQNWEGYCTVSAHSALPVYLENRKTGESDIRYDQSEVYLRSSLYPGQVLCLGRNYYGAFWKSESHVYPPYCSFTLSHSTDFRKGGLEYGDHFVLRSVNWPSFLLGLDSTGSWVVAVLESGSGATSGAVWQLKKTGH